MYKILISSLLNSTIVGYKGQLRELTSNNEINDR